MCMQLNAARNYWDLYKAVWFQVNQKRTKMNIKLELNAIELLILTAMVLIWLVNWLIFELMMFWLTHSEEPSNTKAFV